jgi:8-oxo-dGTP diphosphatase
MPGRPQARSQGSKVRRVTADDGPAVTDYTSTLPRKRMGAGVLFFDAAGRVLLVEPTYKPYWEIPGGAVETGESPRDAAARELKEELGLSCPIGGLLAIDWVPPRPDRTEGLMVVFDGGLLPTPEAAAISVPSDELRGFAFCTGDEVARRLSPLLARRVAACVAARSAGQTAYLENGSPVG